MSWVSQQFKLRQIQRQLASSASIAASIMFFKLGTPRDSVARRSASMGYWSLLAKPRLRRAALSRNLVSRRFLQDVSASKVWLRSNADEQLQTARRLIDQYTARNQPLFLFINLMECHFPYHVDEHFALTAPGVASRGREVAGLYHLFNQTRLVTGKRHIDSQTMCRLRERQRIAWRRLAPKIDEFVRDLRARPEPSTILVCSDHGDNFGDGGWEYHFSNVTEAGNRTPLLWLRHDDEHSRVINTPVSMKEICESILVECGKRGSHLLEQDPSTPVVTESYWYSNQGRTLARFRVNRFSFIVGQTRWVNENGRWRAGRIATGDGEPPLESCPAMDPIEELQLDLDHRDYLRHQFAGFRAFVRRTASPSC